jgi:hypothetical protein
MLPQSPISILKKTKSSRSCDRSVNFFDRVRVLETLNRKDFSQQELDDYWFINEEYCFIKHEIRNTVKFFNQNLYIDETKYCLRGIEHKTQTRKRLKTKIRQDAQMVVLDEQAIQHELGLCNESMIRSVYRMHSHRCAVAAHRKGLEDERLAVFPAIININLPKKLGAVGRPSGMVGPSTPRSMVPTAA